jgi:hypothetical protein
MTFLAFGLLLFALSAPRFLFAGWPFIICRIPGANSWKKLIPASPPIVEPKLAKLAEVERVQYGR